MDATSEQLAKIVTALGRQNKQRLMAMDLSESQSYILITEKRRKLVATIVLWLYSLVAQNRTSLSTMVMIDLLSLINACLMANYMQSDGDLKEIERMLTKFKDKHPELDLNFNLLSE